MEISDSQLEELWLAVAEAEAALKRIDERRMMKDGN